MSSKHSNYLTMTIFTFKDIIFVTNFSVYIFVYVFVSIQFFCAGLYFIIKAYGLSIEECASVLAISQFISRHLLNEPKMQ